MRISEADVGSVLTLVPDGPLDQETAPDLIAKVDEALEASRTRFVVDLSRVPYADSAGLEALVEMASRVFRFGGRLGLFGSAEALAEILRVTRLDQRLALFPSREAALARIREDS